MTWTFERRLVSLVVVAVVGLVSVSGVGYLALQGLKSDIGDLVDNQGLLAAQQDADMMHDALRADVVSALLADDTVSWQQVVVETHEHADRARADMDVGGEAIEAIGLDRDDPVRTSFGVASAAMNSYGDRAVELVELASRDETAARGQLPQFLEEFAAVETQMGDLSSAIEERAVVARDDATERAHDGATRTGLFAAAALTLLVAVVEAMRRSVRAMLAARTLAEEETARISTEVRRDSERQHFKNRVHDALDMVDNEYDLYSVVRRSMAATTHESPAELLLADNSQAHLRLAVDHPESGGPGCPVQSPWDCVAVRRGQTIVFESSEDLNVCPKLRHRPRGACSAVCVPVTFMGRALGVLHTTGADKQPADSDSVERLTVLAAEAGTRIGTVRAFAKTQLQAATDPLTGLPNRRNLEEQVSTLLVNRTPFAVAIADLDHFKQINDKHGHDAGDRALRLFAKVLRSSLREHDIAARYGGEEFAVVFPNTLPDDAAAGLERIREALVLALLDGRCPPFTASFGMAMSDAGDTFDEVVVAADEALFVAKESGRNRVVIAGQQTQSDEVPSAR